MSRKMNPNQQFSSSIIKFLVKAVKEENLLILMGYLPQPVILFLLGEYVPMHEGDVYPSERYKNAQIYSVNYLSGEYIIEYDYTEVKWFKTEEEANAYTESGKYDWDTYKSQQCDTHQFKGIHTKRTTTSVCWDI